MSQQPTSLSNSSSSQDRLRSPTESLNPTQPNSGQQTGKQTTGSQTTGSQTTGTQTTGSHATGTQAAKNVKDDLASQASEAATAVKQTALKATQQAKDAGMKYADEKKSKMAEEVGVFSGAIRKASGKLREENHDSIACYVDAAAEQLDQLRDALQNKSVNQIMQDLQSITRRRPEVVYGGLFFVGLAAMRFLKASKPRRSRVPNQDDRSQQPYAGNRYQSPNQYRPAPSPSSFERMPPPPGAGRGSYPSTASPLPSTSGNITEDEHSRLGTEKYEGQSAGSPTPFGTPSPLGPQAGVSGLGPTTSTNTSSGDTR